MKIRNIRVIRVQRMNVQMKNTIKKHNARAAFTIVELVAAIMIVTLCMAAFVKIAHVARQQRDYSREHQTAVDQTLNVLERLAAADPEQLAAGTIDLSPQEALIARSLPDGKLLVTCEPLAEATAVPMWRLNAVVSWKPETNLPQRSIALTRLLARLQTVDEGLQASDFRLQEESVTSHSLTEPEGGAE